MAEEEIKIDLLGLGIFDENTTVGDIRQIFKEKSKSGILENIRDKREDKSIYNYIFDSVIALLLYNGEEKDQYNPLWIKYINLVDEENRNRITQGAGDVFRENTRNVGKKANVYTVLAYYAHDDNIDEFPFKDSYTLKKVYKFINNDEKMISDSERKERILKIFNSNGNVLTLNRYETEDKSMQPIIEEIIDLIETGGVRQIIFTGAPGTGKTYIAKKIAEELGDDLTWEKLKNKNNDDVSPKYPKYAFVQFHPSYDYTDFVEGIRPISKGDNISFVKMDGIFKKFCRNVINANKESEDSDEKLYFFIIDEINRADLAKVFGELMYCLEKDKRGEENSVKTQYHNLPTYDSENEDKDENKKGGFITDDVFTDGFYIPENVVIIGTMNDIDRSVESMDFALRRRFEWKEFEVTEEMLVKAFKETDNDNNPIFDQVIYDNAEDIASRVMKLNREVIEKHEGLNKQYFISQGQFANIPENIPDEEPDDKIDSDLVRNKELIKLLNYVWKYRISTLLREYVRGEDETEVEKFINKCHNAFIPEFSKSKDDGSSPSGGNGDDKDTMTGTGDSDNLADNNKGDGEY